MDQKSKSLHDEIIMLEAKSTLEGEIRHSSIRKRESPRGKGNQHLLLISGHHHHLLGIQHPTSLQRESTHYNKLEQT